VKDKQGILENLDPYLAHWPVPERATSAQAFTERVLASVQDAQNAVANVSSGLIDQDAKFLLAPSLSESNNTVSEGTQPQDRHAPKTETAPVTEQEDKRMTASRRSFKDLAKLATTQTGAPPSSVAPGPISSADREDSGVIDLQASLSVRSPESIPSASSSAPYSMPAPANSFPPAPMSSPAPLSMPAPIGMAPMAPPSAPASVAPQSAPVSSTAGNLWASSPAIPAAPSVPSNVNMMVAAAPQAYVAPQAQAQAIVTEASSKRGSGKVIAAALGIAAMAAGAFFVVKSSREQTPSPAPVAFNVPSGAAPKTGSQGTESPTNPATAVETPESAMGVGPETLAVKGAQRPIVNTGGGRPVAAAPVDNRLPAPAEKVEQPVAKVEVKKVTGGPSGALGDEMRKAAGASDTEVVVAKPEGPQFAAGSVPQKPSQGAVTSALSSALPSARACASADDDVSRATVVFTSAGSVQSVSVSGGAAGKPAAECMKSALMRAKVAPFAESTFTTSVTIRK
jgi:hypothetical protein